MTATASLRPVARPSSRLYLVGVFLSLSTIIAASFVVWERREETIASYKRENTNLSIVLAEQTARSMQAIDLVVREVQTKAQSAGLTNLAQFRQMMGTEETHKFLVDRLTMLPQANAIGFVGADGTLINSSRQWPPPTLDVSDRDYYLHFRDHDDRGAFISAPVRNRISGAWTFFLGRRIGGSHNEFLGIVLGVIDIGYLEEFYQAITLHEGGSVTILRHDGTMLARYPHVERMMGEKLSAESPWYTVVEAGGGSYRTPGYIDGIPRLVSVHLLHDYPIIVAVTISEDAALAAWRRESVVAAIAALCVAVGFAVLFAVLAARSRRLEQQTAVLAELAEALRNSQERVHGFAVTSSDWFWETDENHRITYVSEGIRVFGQDPSTRIGKSRMELSADAKSDAAKWQEHLAVLNRHEPFRNFVYTRKVGDQPEHTISVSGDPFADSAGRFLGYRGTARDVSQQIAAERLLREAKSAAEAASHAKSQFLANMSHELQTPLNAIIGFSEGIKLGIAGPRNPQVAEYAGFIHQSGEHLLRIISDILDLSKVDAGKFELQEEPGIDPQRVASTCVSLMRDRAKGGAVQLSLETDGDLPLPAADPTRLKQILLNLISNAVKFTEPNGSVVLSVRRAKDGGMEFEVRDTGPGMTTEEIKLALEPFNQVDGDIQRRYQGTGLGLPLARCLAELHGGSLDIESEKARGTTVIVTLPATRVLDDQAADTVTVSVA